MSFLNNVYVSDCVDFMKKIKKDSIDMILTSPPYDDLRDYKGYNFNFENTAKEMYRILKDGGIAVWIVGDKTENGDESGTSFKQALRFKEIGFKLHDTMIYQKDSSQYPRKDAYLSTFEYMFILSKKGVNTFNPMVKRGKYYTSSPKSITTRQKDGITTERIKNDIIYITP